MSNTNLAATTEVGKVCPTMYIVFPIAASFPLNVSVPVLSVVNENSSEVRVDWSR
jgi:hypothetical protein